MAEAAALLLVTFGLALVGIGYEVAARIRGQARLTRRRELQGGRARLAGVVCIAVSVSYWWWLVRIWSLYDR